MPVVQFQGMSFWGGLWPDHKKRPRPRSSPCLDISIEIVGPSPIWKSTSLAFLVADFFFTEQRAKVCWTWKMVKGKPKTSPWSCLLYLKVLAILRVCDLFGMVKTWPLSKVNRDLQLRNQVDIKLGHFESAGWWSNFCCCLVSHCCLGGRTSFLIELFHRNHSHFSHRKCVGWSRNPIYLDQLNQITWFWQLFWRCFCCEHGYINVWRYKLGWFPNFLADVLVTKWDLGIILGWPLGGLTLKYKHGPVIFTTRWARHQL